MQREFQSTISWRDLREVAVAVLMIPIWLVMGVFLSLPWTWYLTVPALLWITGFILVDRRRHPQTTEAGQPLLDLTKDSLAQVEHQIWLLRNVLWWYLLPCALPILVFLLDVAWHSSGAWWQFAVIALVSLLFVVAVYGSIYRLNQRAVRDTLEPRRQELQQLIDSLEDDTATDFSGMQQMTKRRLSMTCTWAENWNRLIPSWREAGFIVLVTFSGMCIGLLAQVEELGPAFFRGVVGAVVAFEVSLASVWLWTHYNKQSAGTDPERSMNEGRWRLPLAPAVVIIALTLVLSVLAVLSIFTFIRSQTRSVGLESVSEFTEGDASNLDEWLQRIVDAADYPSLNVAIVRNGEIVYRGAFGFEDLEAQRPATPQTQYHVASVTKVFTATLAATLHERGVVDLDETVAKYLPANVLLSTTPEIGSQITLRQLASHTSGLPRGVPGQVQSVEGWYQLEPQRLYHLLADVELESQPGTVEEYSNLGFGLLGHALERAAGKPFDQLVQEFICEPLTLTRTAIQADDSLRPATGYSRRSGGAIEHSFKERLAASGGLVTTAEDLAKFLAAQMKPGKFSKEVLDQLHTETMLSSGDGSRNALGWAIRSNEYVGRVLKKNGGRSNCSAWIGFAPEHSVGVAVVTNCGGPDVDPIGYKLLEQSVPSR